MKKFSLVLALFGCLFFLNQTHAQTPGSIAFVGIQTTSTSVFSVLVINPIPAGTVIRFTDNAWDGDNLLNTESVMTWTSPGSTLNTGAIIRFTDTGGANAQVTGGGSANGKLANLAGGDQILAFTGDVGSPSFIAGISTKNWLSTCTALGGDTSTCLPVPLAIGVNSIALSESDTTVFENGFFSTTNFIGTAEEMRLAVNNVNYWTKNSDPAIAGVSAWPTWSFTVGAPFPSVVRFIQSSATVVEGESAVNIQLQLNFPQAVPQIIRMNVLNFGGTTPADYVTNPPVVNNVLEINVAPNQTNVSFSIQAILDGIPEGDEVVSFSLANLTSGLSIGSPSTCVVTIQDNDQNFSNISFAQSSYSITEGDAPINIVLNIEPPFAVNQTVTINVLNGSNVDATDYTTNPAAINSNITLNIPANSATAQFLFTVLNDQTLESDETVTFTITQVSNALQIVEPSTVVVTIIDNDTPIIVVPELIINELMPVNINTGADEFGQFDPWIEILNLSNNQATLSELYISDDPLNPLKFQFPILGSSILDLSGNGFKLIWADATTSQGPLHTNFTLNPQGGYVSLFASDGLTLIDSVSYPAIPVGKTYGRTTDGSPIWKIFNLPTPAASNQDTIPSALRPLEDFDFLQIFPNPASKQVYLRFKAGSKKDITISLTDISGKLIHRKMLSNVDEGNNVILDIENLTSGIYLIEATNKYKKYVQKLIISN